MLSVIRNDHKTTTRITKRVFYPQLHNKCNQNATKKENTKGTLPEPKKPVIIVAEMRLSGGILVVKPESSVWGAEEVVSMEETEKRRRWREGVVLRRRDWWVFCGLSKKGSRVERKILVGWWEVKETNVVAMSTDTDDNEAMLMLMPSLLYFLLDFEKQKEEVLPFQPSRVLDIF